MKPEAVALKNKLEILSNEDIVNTVGNDYDFTLNELLMLRKLYFDREIKDTEKLESVILQKKIEKYGKGFKGYIYGTRSLNSAFWKVGVLGGVIVFIILATTVQNNLDHLYWMMPLLLTYKIFSWYSIHQCSVNEKSDISRIVVHFVVGLDILFVSVKWLFGYIILLN